MLTPALPFLRRTELFLAPIAALVAAYCVALFFQWNVSLSVFRYYGLHAQDY